MLVEVQTKIQESRNLLLRRLGVQYEKENIFSTKDGKDFIHITKKILMSI